MSEENLFVAAGARLDSRVWMRGVCAGRRLALVSDTDVFRRYGSGVQRALSRMGFAVMCHLLPSAEAAKSWTAVEALLVAMLRRGLGRDAALIAFGGGSVTDAAGFAAAVYLRGIPWVIMPTTLLGQLDSGLGGKTGINLAGGKNLVGAFHRPSAVVCDPDVLRSLPLRERVSGLGEALKYGLVFDPPLWRRMRRQWDALCGGVPGLTSEVIRRSVAWKRKIVALDPRETEGPRELLNFGHTLGHALESSCGPGVLRHGEAVIWGMRAALRLSVENAGLSPFVLSEADQFLASIPVPRPRRVDLRGLLDAARRDKKNRRGAVRFVLLRSLGRPVVRPVSERSIRAVSQELFV